MAVNPNLTDKAQVVAGLAIANRILGFVNAPALMQRVVAEVLGATADLGLYAKKRDLICQVLSEAGFEVKKPAGAFYLFPRTLIADDVAFCRAAQEECILIVPGSGFMGPGHFRLAYCCEDRGDSSARPRPSRGACQVLARATRAERVGSANGRPPPRPGGRYALACLGAGSTGRGRFPERHPGRRRLAAGGGQGDGRPGAVMSCAVTPQRLPPVPPDLGAWPGPSRRPAVAVGCDAEVSPEAYRRRGGLALGRRQLPPCPPSWRGRGRGLPWPASFPPPGPPGAPGSNRPGRDASGLSSSPGWLRRPLRLLHRAPGPGQAPQPALGRSRRRLRPPGPSRRGRVVLTGVHLGRYGWDLTPRTS